MGRCSGFFSGKFRSRAYNDYFIQFGRFFQFGITDIGFGKFQRYAGKNSCPISDMARRCAYLPNGKFPAG